MILNQRDIDKLAVMRAVFINMIIDNDYKLTKPIVLNWIGDITESGWTTLKWFVDRERSFEILTDENDDSYISQLEEILKEIYPVEEYPEKWF